MVKLLASSVGAIAVLFGPAQGARAPAWCRYVEEYAQQWVTLDECNPAGNGFMDRKQTASPGYCRFMPASRNVSSDNCGEGTRHCSCISETCEQYNGTTQTLLPTCCDCDKAKEALKDPAVQRDVNSRSACYFVPDANKDEVSQCQGTSRRLSAGQSKRTWWCQYVPQAAHNSVNRCADSTGCDCQDNCKDNSVEAQKSMPECCKCEVTVENSQANGTSTSYSARASTNGTVVRGPTGKMVQVDGNGVHVNIPDNGTTGLADSLRVAINFVAVKGQPSWCSLIPGNYQNVACRSETACQCSETACTTSEARTSENPTCCSCEGVGQYIPNSVVSMYAASASPVSGVKKPAYCEWIPNIRAAQEEACPPCQCQDHCDRTKAEPNNMECCGCEVA